MLLTLNAACLKPLIAKGDLDLLDLPKYTRETLSLHGINLSTEQIAGLARNRIEALRERADKSGCACLLLIEPEPLPFGSSDDAEGDAAADRAVLVARVAGLLGCNAAAVRCAGGTDEVGTDLTIERLKHVMENVERLELNLLISPWGGKDDLTGDPERVTGLIKRVGGFRIGTLPDFADAARAKDPVAYLRRITPYASTVVATTLQFVAKGKSTTPGSDPDAPVDHRPWDLQPMIDAISSVGYASPLAIEYRGEGDPTLGVLRSRALLEAALGKSAGA